MRAWGEAGRIATLAVMAAGLLAGSGCRAAGPHVPGPNVDAALASKPGRETAVFAGGCFWGTQTVFEHVKGVLTTAAGYDGGKASEANYGQVTTETTNHAESVEIVFNPSKITYGELLQVFFAIHDPTTRNRQGPDIGKSYRSVIFTISPEQARISHAYIAQLSAARVFPQPIVTEVTPSPGFYRAEEYHQDYAMNNPNNPYIMVCDRPKLATLKTEFPQLYTTYKGK